MSEQDKQAKRKRRRAKSGSEPYIVTRALTHIHLLDANAGKLAALDALAPVYLSLCQQYVTLFCEGELPNKLRVPASPPSCRAWHRVRLCKPQALRKVGEQSATAYQDYLTSG